MHNQHCHIYIVLPVDSMYDCSVRLTSSSQEAWQYHYNTYECDQNSLAPCEALLLVSILGVAAIQAAVKGIQNKTYFCCHWVVMLVECCWGGSSAGFIKQIPDLEIIILTSSCIWRLLLEHRVWLKLARNEWRKRTSFVLLFLAPVLWSKINLYGFLWQRTGFRFSEQLMRQNGAGDENNI